MSFRIVTISREFGSGGHRIGKMVAEKLGIQYYDNELVTKIAEKSGFAQSFIQEHGEETNATNSLLFSLSNWGTYYNYTVSDQLYFAQRRVIEELANKAPCVIVGRCADYILRERTDCLNVFIHANMDFKRKRIIELYGEKGTNLDKKILEKDKRRKAYYKYYTNQSWGEALNYHLCLDSGIIGLEKCADVIAQLMG
ncbi:cytidylate kinase-like family protein [Solibaculum mannosilyticum]|uniref:Cytidylate kinase n=1 Tax=Solibaculum mannosilyticum TaxID=2780922 RepID=A0A7I8D0P0_9FIRM|nr:cytidylate kinase-like family protein [Solibaculum mannosilyticum]MCO7136496.1 cytidylate kinase-like family protein [[Clostridium] leptum]BCI60350.1 cytidylate kinase [Solibaculum mannosilyticum]CZT54989.1 cytidylate kinase [Eubacteriaceae bacterium CHKCI005]